VAAIEATGGLEYTAQLARSEAERALTALDTLPGSPYKDGLMALARFSVEHTT
jgi:octaprenyl-diphosphate synthase